jgi:5-methylcytosine-specific restriction endonuclease McrA
MSRDKRYHTKTWKALRLSTLRRDRYLCKIKLPGCKVIATEVDHIIEPSRGGAFMSPVNTQSACKSCNVSKRNRNLAADARAQRNPRSREW